MIYWSRGQKGKLSEHFSTREFTCKCGMCRDQRISNDLIKMLEEVRAAYGKPITISSGFRCERHNKAVGGVKNSQHVQGNAADITGSDLQELLEACERVFAAIGTAKTFVHVDTRKDKVRRWVY